MASVLLSVGWTSEPCASNHRVSQAGSAPYAPIPRERLKGQRRWEVGRVGETNVPSPHCSPGHCLILLPVPLICPPPSVHLCFPSAISFCSFCESPHLQVLSVCLHSLYCPQAHVSDLTPLCLSHQVPTPSLHNDPTCLSPHRWCRPTQPTLGQDRGACELALSNQTPHQSACSPGQTSISIKQPGQEADTIGLGLGVIRPRLNHRVGGAGHPGTRGSHAISPEEL